MKRETVQMWYILQNKHCIDIAHTMLSIANMQKH